MTPLLPAGTAEPSPPEPLPGARLLFSLDPGRAYLNHGAFGAAPLTVQRAQQRLRDELEANPQAFHTRGLADRIGYCRRHLATFLGAEPDLTAMVANVTAGVAVVLRSLRLPVGAEVVTTNHGYGAVDIALDEAGLRRRVVPVALDADEEEIIESVRAAVTPGRTRLVVIDLVTSSTARLFPAAKIVQALRETEVPVFVDGAHAPGMVDLDITSLGADFFVGSLRKWLFAPTGTAIVTVAGRWREVVRPTVTSWSQPNGYPANVEIGGTLDYSAWLAAPIGLYTLRTLGLDRVRQHNDSLAAYGQYVVGAALGIAPADLPAPGGLVSMRVVPLNGVVAEQVSLRDHIANDLRTEINIAIWGGRPLLRLCAQVYNRPDEYERLADQLPALLRGYRTRS